jgi:hypothetical protein
MISEIENEDKNLAIITTEKVKYIFDTNEYKVEDDTLKGIGPSIIEPGNLERYEKLGERYFLKCGQLSKPEQIIIPLSDIEYMETEEFSTWRTIGVTAFVGVIIAVGITIYSFNQSDFLD